MENIDRLRVLLKYFKRVQTEQYPNTMTLHGELYEPAFYDGAQAQRMLNDDVDVSTNDKIDKWCERLRD